MLDMGVENLEKFGAELSVPEKLSEIVKVSGGGRPLYRAVYNTKSE